jgi:RNA-directed DNA polymerase
MAESRGGGRRAGDTGDGRNAARGVISPLLANIYLHYVFDLWATQWRQRHARGDVVMVRYADDIVIGFEHQADAERFWEDMRTRLAEFALTLHPGKTRPVEFGRHAAKNRRARGLGNRRRLTSLASLTSAGTADREASNSSGSLAATGCAPDCR